MQGSIIAKNEARKNWENARQAAIFEQLSAVFTGRSVDLLSFDDVKEQLRLTQVNYRGEQEIPISSIRGSVGRYRDFTSTFLPRKRVAPHRWQRIDILAFDQGVPPVEVYKVGDAYFVLDGNHRISVAKQSSITHIQAIVWEYTTETGLSAEADVDEVFLKAEYSQFMEKTHLSPQNIDEEIVFTEPGMYRKIEYQIAIYQKALEKIDEEPVSYHDAAELWHDMIYTPAIQIIAERGVMDLFPTRTPADLFIWVWRHHEELQERGIITIADAADIITAPWYKRLWKKLISP